MASLLALAAQKIQAKTLLGILFVAARLVFGGQAPSLLLINFNPICFHHDSLLYVCNLYAINFLITPQWYSDMCFGLHRILCIQHLGTVIHRKESIMCFARSGRNGMMLSLFIFLLVCHWSPATAHNRGLMKLILYTVNVIV